VRSLGAIARKTLFGESTMPDATYLAMSGARLAAVAGKASLANSVLRCFKFGFMPNINSTLAEFLANECDFDGYDPITIAAWNDPVLAGAAYAIFSPTETFRWDHDTADVGNAVGGTFLVSAGGDLLSYTIFDPSRPAQGPDQAIITTPTAVYRAG
jgi:hypothetical protein